MILDVGCGHLPKGDVNVDLFPDATLHRSLNQSKLTDMSLRVKNIPNFIVADGCYLPFRDNIFDVVYSSHTIEHTKGFKFFAEMVRVSNDRIELICPNQLGGRRDKGLHIYFINKSWCLEVLRLFGLIAVKLVYSDYSCFPHRYLPLVRLPKEITFLCRKFKGDNNA